MMLTPTPFPLGAIVMGTNSCAVDTVGCHMVHVDPKDLIHLRFASERGFGPMSLDEIEVSGDFPLGDVQEKTKNFEFCLERIDNYFGEDNNISCTVGTFPEGHSADYCWGGCPGALQEAMHIFKGFYPDAQNEMKKVRYVVGRVEGPIDVAGDERVLFSGDCTSWKGRINGKNISIKSSYKTTKEVDARNTKTHDMLLRIISALWNCLIHRSSPYIHAKGCPVSVADHVNYLSSVGKIRNPNFDPRLAVGATVTYWQMRFKRFVNRFLG
jgi:hypothetical protein